MADVNDLEQRITIIEDTEAIKRLKYRYWHSLDLKEWAELAASRRAVSEHTGSLAPRRGS
jgi:hypothetical protein